MEGLQAWDGWILGGKGTFDDFTEYTSCGHGSYGWKGTTVVVSGFGWDSGIGWLSIAVVVVVGPLVLARARMLIICLLDQTLRKAMHSTIWLRAKSLKCSSIGRSLMNRKIFSMF